MQTGGRHILKRLLTASIVLLFLTGESFSLTWQEAQALLKQNNNELRSAKKQLDSSSWTYRRAYGALLPQLSANLSAGQSSVSTAAATSSYSYGLNANLDLFNSSDYYNLRSAYVNYQYNEANYKLNEAGILYTVRQAFIDLLIAQENVDLRKKILKQRQDNGSLIELRYDSGVENKGNLMQTKADEANAKYNLSSAQRDLGLAKLKLSQLLGAQIALVEEDLKFTASAQQDYDLLTSGAPDYLAAKYQLESADVQRQSTLSGFLPSVSLSGSYRKSGSSWPPSTDSNSVSFNVSYSLFPGGTNFIDKIIYDLNYDKAREDFEKSRKDTRYNIVQAYEKYADALEALEISKGYLAAALERSEIAQSQYINGLITYDEWSRIEDSYISAQSNLLNSQKSALSANAAWQKSYGGYVK
ncbi:MAG: TolC family protein [Candidatus Margulisiibacteriota bacterium]